MKEFNLMSQLRWCQSQDSPLCFFALLEPFCSHCGPNPNERPSASKERPSPLNSIPSFCNMEELCTYINTWSQKKPRNKWVLQNVEDCLTTVFYCNACKKMFTLYHCSWIIVSSFALDHGATLRVLWKPLRATSSPDNVACLVSRVPLLHCA